MYKKCPVIVGGFGLAILGFGILCSSIIFPKLADAEVKKQTQLIEGGDSWKNWQKFPVPMKFKIYFFNVTNPEEVQHGGAPIVKEIGPYVYDLYREKVRIKINQANDTVEYYERKYYYFNEDESGCRTEDDLLTVASLVIIGTALKIERTVINALSTMSEALPFLFPGIKDIFMRGRARDILFDGLPLNCKGEEIEFVCKELKNMLPETVRTHPNKIDFLFSLFHHLNGTDEGPYVIQLGNAPNTTKGEILSWHGVGNQSIWFGNYCNKIRGTDGNTYPIVGPNVKRLYAFSSDFCRTMYVDKVGMESYKGLPSYKYATPESALGRNKDNDCYCPRIKNLDEEFEMVCTPKGTFDIFPCITAPSLISLPHFYMADEKLVRWVKGMKPVKEKHETFMNIDPLTGTPLSGHKRFQINVHVRNYKEHEFDLMGNVTEGIIPVFWLDEGIDLPDHLLKLVEQGHMGIKLLGIMKWFLILTGLGLILGALALTMRKERLLCFSNNGSAKVSQLQLSSKKNQRSQKTIANVISNGEFSNKDLAKAELKFNTAVQYPGAFSQQFPNDNGVNSNMIRMRQQHHNLNEEANWTFKN